MVTSPKRATAPRCVVAVSGQRATCAPAPSSTKGTSVVPSVSNRRRPGCVGTARTVTSVPYGRSSGSIATSCTSLWCRYSGGRATISTSSSQRIVTGAWPLRATRTSAPSSTDHVLATP